MDEFQFDDTQLQVLSNIERMALECQERSKIVREASFHAGILGIRISHCLLSFCQLMKANLFISAGDMTRSVCDALLEIVASAEYEHGTSHFRTVREGDRYRDPKERRDCRDRDGNKMTNQHLHKVMERYGVTDSRRFYSDTSSYTHLGGKALFLARLISLHYLQGSTVRYIDGLAGVTSNIWKMLEDAEVAANYATLVLNVDPCELFGHNEAAMRFLSSCNLCNKEISVDDLLLSKELQAEELEGIKLGFEQLQQHRMIDDALEAEYVDLTDNKEMASGGWIPDGNTYRKDYGQHGDAEIRKYGKGWGFNVRHKSRPRGGGGGYYSALDAARKCGLWVALNPTALADT